MATSRILQRIDGKSVVFHHGTGAWAVAIHDDFTALLYPPEAPRWVWVVRRHGADAELGEGDSILEVYALARAKAEALRAARDLSAEALLAAAEALNVSYSLADAFDARVAEHGAADEEAGDELGELHKAALSRGQP